MFLYRSFGLNLQSELEFPDLPPAEGEPDIRIYFGTVANTKQRASLHDEIALHTHGGAFRIRHGKEIVIDAPPDTDLDVLRVLIAGRMMAFLLRQRGWLALHASGVLVDGNAVLFLGKSGAGKSTVAAGFYSKGYPLITDDIAAVRISDGRCVVCSAAPRLRLTADAAATIDNLGVSAHFQWDKCSYVLNGQEPLADTIPVRRIYLLEYDDQFRSTPIPEISAVALLSAHSFFKRRRMDVEASEHHLVNCCKVASQVPLFRLSRPHSLDKISEVIDWVRQDIQ